MRASLSSPICSKKVMLIRHYLYCQNQISCGCKVVILPRGRLSCWRAGYWGRDRVLGAICRC
ncbi:uncharacterized protein BDV17DRAFT_256183 [Aspergillus undulatus]|uniref:uncharacterized protein n=1 Tax=Aspergillus undulatus TaxID=1810928 RepID=UPI003CCD998A